VGWLPEKTRFRVPSHNTRTELRNVHPCSEDRWGALLDTSSLDPGTSAQEICGGSGTRTDSIGLHVQIVALTMFRLGGNEQQNMLTCANSPIEFPADKTPATCLPAAKQILRWSSLKGKYLPNLAEFQTLPGHQIWTSWPLSVLS
jgi:hypothetical protein